MATNIHCCLVLTCLLLVGCVRGPKDEAVVLQVKRVLEEAQSDCAIDVSSLGAGEGDSDNAYVAVHLEAGEISSRRSKDIEVLFSDLKEDHWKLQSEASKEVVAAAKQLCDQVEVPQDGALPTK